MKKHNLKHRFQITLLCDAGHVTHVCAAHTEEEAVDRMMQSYKKSNPGLVNVRPLGILPKPRTPHLTCTLNNLRSTFSSGRW